MNKELLITIIIQIFSYPFKIGEEQTGMLEGLKNEVEEAVSSYPEYEKIVSEHGNLNWNWTDAAPTFRINDQGRLEFECYVGVERDSGLVFNLLLEFKPDGSLFSGELYEI